MSNLLSLLHNCLAESYEENLKSNELKYFSDGTMDVLQTFLSIKKTEKDLRLIMIKGSKSSDELKYLDKDNFEYLIKNKLIVKGTGTHSDRVFIGLNGLMEYYLTKEIDPKESFIAYDNRLFPEVKYSLKSQEKILCVLLILLGADKEENLFNSESLTPDDLKSYHNFLKLIEKVMGDNGVDFGRSINWETGKDISFRKFITNNVQLPKTGLYHKVGDYKYYLNLSTRKNSVYLLDLILDNYSELERVDINDAFYHSLKKLSFMMVTEIGIIRTSLNKNIIDVLDG